MTTSNIRRLRNEMHLLERESDKYIPYDMYYIVKIIGDTVDSGVVEKWGKNFLTKNVIHQPLISYIFQTKISMEIFLVYSCLEEGEKHYLQGSHSKIISQYVSLLSQELGVDIRVSIIEFETRTQVLMYFSYLVHQNSQTAMIIASRNGISAADIRNHTQQELLGKLRDIEVDWSSLPGPEKYGMFYKLKKRQGKVVIASMSEVFDARNTKKYSVFIFGS